MICETTFVPQNEEKSFEVSSLLVKKQTINGLNLLSHN